MSSKIIVATRPSMLAYTQTKQVVALLQEANPEICFEIQKFSTQGDRDQKSSLTAFGGTGVFVKELEHALLTKKADIAIHSLKDMPSVQPSELCLAAFPKREDPRDVFIVNKEPIKTVGTGSPRRLLQCAVKKANVSFVEIRGNIETRLEKMKNGHCDATYLAAAGLKRLGLEPENANFLDVEDFIPAIGQGVLAIECRIDDERTRQIVEKITDKKTFLEVKAERAFMQEIQGGCKFPLAAHAYFKDDKLRFLAIIGDLKELRYVRRTEYFTLENIEEQAINLAKEMLKECEKEKIQLTF